MYILRKTIREFTSDQCLDLAAALTYYGVLAVFPALLAFVSILGLVGDAQETTESLLGLLNGLVPPNMLTALEEPIKKLTESPGAGLTFVTGIVGALWSASGFVGAFGRAMNRIYSIQEGRPFWKLRPVTLLVTVIAIVVAVIAAVLVVLSGPVAEAIGEALGLGEGVLVVWNIARWPVLAGLLVMVVAVLYYATPNVQQPKFRWMSLGALLALVIWVLASLGFGFYVTNFSSYNATYGSIGGVIVFLLWVWISNIALLFGAELDAEMERGRQLQAGIAAEETIQLPPRDTRQSDKQAEKHAKDVRVGLALRRSNGERDTPASSDRPNDDEDNNKNT
jgi:membrane protein